MHIQLYTHCYPNNNTVIVCLLYVVLHRHFVLGITFIGILILRNELSYSVFIVMLLHVLKMCNHGQS
uniref:Uncharacterized protein n=1 Tax=Anguilla anguilla TaxID=7936 RepID=A0A0E9T8M4_ANGAN